MLINHWWLHVLNHNMKLQDKSNTSVRVKQTCSETKKTRLMSLGIHALSSVIMKDSSYAVVLELAVNNGVMPCAGGILITLGWENVYETSRVSWPASRTLQTWGKYVREEAFSDPISGKVCIFRVHVSLMNMIKVLKNMLWWQIMKENKLCNCCG